MEEKQKKVKAESRINQFIIECMFNKYFEEEKHEEVIVEKEEARV